MSDHAPWTVEHFSQSNPKGSKGQGSVPTLLRRVAKSIDALGEVQVQDVVLHVDIDDEGRDWPTMTVYFHRTPVE